VFPCFRASKSRRPPCWQGPEVLRFTAVLCDRIAVLSRGAIVEMAEAGTLLGAPRHDVTRALIAAARSNEVFRGST
jgi:ABC-type dipeptide/oligopeptide/nickel transport system ATPase component